MQQGNYAKSVKIQKDKYAWSHLCVESLKTNSRTVVTTEAGRWRKREDIDQRVKSFSYKMNKFYIPNVSYVTVNNNALHT